MKQDVFTGLEAACNRATHDARFWIDVCDEASKLVGGVGALFLPIVPKGRGPWLIRSTSIQELITRYVEEGWYKQDYRENGTEICLQKGYMTDHDFVTREEMEHIPYYRDLLFHYGLGICIGMTFDTENGIWALAIQCSKDRPPLSDDEIKTTKQIKATIQNATQEASSVARQKLEEFTHLLGETNNNILLLDGDGDIVEQKSVAGIYCDMDEIRPGSNVKNLLSEEFHGEVDKVCASTAEENINLSFVHEIGSQKFSTHMMQVPPSIRHFYTRAKVIVFTSHFEASKSKHDEILKDIYGLTHSEIKATNLMADGNSIKTISELLDLSEKTIRQRFKTIYSKTGCHRQAELVSFVYKLSKR